MVIMTFAMLSKMVEHLGFSFMVHLFGILYRIATAIASTFFVLILSRSILQFSGSTHLKVPANVISASMMVPLLPGLVLHMCVCRISFLLSKSKND